MFKTLPISAESYRRRRVWTSRKQNTCAWKPGRRAATEVVWWWYFSNDVKPSGVGARHLDSRTCVNIATHPMQTCLEVFQTAHTTKTVHNSDGTHTQVKTVHSSDSTHTRIHTNTRTHTHIHSFTHSLTPTSTQTHAGRETLRQRAEDGNGKSHIRVKHKSWNYNVKNLFHNSDSTPPSHDCSQLTVHFSAQDAKWTKSYTFQHKTLNELNLALFSTRL